MSRYISKWVEMKERFQEALELVDPDGKLKKTVWGQFWSSHQRFFKYMCIACKVPHVVSLAQKALIDNKCVVIGLQSTGEARTLDQLDEYGALNGGEFISTARGVLQNLVEKNFPTLGLLADKSSTTDTTATTTTGSKNSQRVNDILQRLSSYTNSSVGNRDKTGKRRGGVRKLGRSSSMSSTSSVDSDQSPTTSSGRSYNDENDDPEFESDLEDEDIDEMDDHDSDLEDDGDEDEDESTDDENISDFELDQNNNNNSTANPTSNLGVIKKNRRVMPRRSIIDDLSAELTDEPDLKATTNNDAGCGGFDSDDSDELFSITKSVSLQSLISMNNLQAAVHRKRSMLSSEEKREAKIASKRRKTNDVGNVDAKKVTLPFKEGVQHTFFHKA